MVKKKRERLAGGVDSVLHISTKRTKPNHRAPVNIEAIANDIFVNYGCSEMPVDHQRTLSQQAVLQSCNEAPTLYKQLDIIQRFKRRAQRWAASHNNADGDSFNENQFFRSWFQDASEFRLFIHIFCHVQGTPLRRTLCSMFDALHTINPSETRKVTTTVVREILSTATLTSDADKFCSMLGALFESVPTRKVLIETNFDEKTSLAVKVFYQLGGLIDNVVWKDALGNGADGTIAPTGQYVQNIERQVEQLLRPVLQLILLSCNDPQTGKTAKFQDYLAAEKRQAGVVIDKICRHCVRVLHFSLLSSDVLTQAGMVFGYLSFVDVLKSDGAHTVRNNSTLFVQEIFGDNGFMGLNWKTLGLTSKLAVCRGVMNAFPTHTWAFSGVHECPNPNNLFEGMDNCKINAIIMQGAVSVEVPSRSYAFQTLGQCLRCLMSDSIKISPRYLQNLVDIVLENWEHPAKRVAALMPSLFEKILQAQMMQSDLEQNNKFQSLVPLLKRVTALPVERKAKYLALQSFLAHGDGQEIYARHPNILNDLLVAVSDVSNIANLVATFLRPFLCSIRDGMFKAKGIDPSCIIPLSRQAKQTRKRQKAKDGESDALPFPVNPEAAGLLGEWRSFWGKPIAEALCTGAFRSRQRISMFVLPEILAIDRLGGAVSLINCIKHQRKALTDEDRLWAAMEVLNAARRGGISRGSSVDLLSTSNTPGGSPIIEAVLDIQNDKLTLSRENLSYALRSAERQIYLSALELICVSKEIKLALTRVELALLKDHLPLLIKTDIAQGGEIKTRLTTLLKHVLRRMVESVRVAKHTVKTRERTRNKWNNKQDKAYAAATKAYNEAHENWSLLKTNTLSFVRWLETFLLGCLYPGAPIERVGMALEIVLLLVRVFKKSENLFYAENEPPMLYALPKILNSEQTVTMLLNTVILSWDQTRRLSCEILKVLPSPWKGYETPDKLEGLMKWALLLSGSPRTRESDAGAQILRLVFRKFAMDLNWYVPFSQTKSSEHATKADVKFLQDIVICLESRILTTLPSLTSIQKSDAERGPVVSDVTKSIAKSSPPISGSKTGPPLPHGLFQALRYITQDNKVNAVSNKWKTVCQDLVQCALQADALALTVVGEDTSVGNMEAERPSVSPETSLDGSETDPSSFQYKARGPINPNSIQYAPPKVDCRGHIIVEEGNSEIEQDGQAEQIIVVGSWLIVKESSLFLAELVSHWKFTTEEKKPETEYTASYNTIKEIGHRLLVSLLTLKHMGAIAAAGQAFCALCMQLFQVQKDDDDANPGKETHDMKVSQLPMVWLEELLNRVDGKGPKYAHQQFFLRRSTGFATAFSSILRADNSHGTKTLRLKHALERLFQAAADPALFSSEADPTDTLTWRRRVHSLNVLKMVFEDSRLATFLQPHAARAIEMAIHGFRSISWAVRNSSMMLFSATLRLTVGQKREKDDFSRRNRTTADQFFGRFPSLYGYFYNELVEASEWKTSPEALSDMHPTLFPILLVLARLDTSETRRGDARALVHDLNVFVPLLRQCSTHTHHKARVMTARALSTILTNPGMIETEISSMVGDLTLAASFKGCLHQNHNAMHGVLLNIYHTLCNSKPNRSDWWSLHENLRCSVVKKMLAVANTFLLWAVTNIWCYPIHKVVLQTFITLADLEDQRAPDEANAFIPCTLNYARSMLKAIAAGPRQPLVDLGKTEMLELCASVIAKYGTTETIIGDVLEWMDDSKYSEVRLACLKGVKRRIKHDPAALSKDTLVRTLLTGNTLNSSPYTRRYHLRLLSICGLPEDAPAVGKLWEVLMNACSETTMKASPRMCGEALELIGEIYEKGLLQAPGIDCLKTCRELLTFCSLEDRDLHVRYGAVGLLGSLKKTFLESNVRSPSDLLLQWKVALRLLQDNDNDVRRRAELVVGELVNKKHVRGSALLRHVHKVLCETYCDSDLRELLIEHFSQVVESVASQLQEKCTYAQTSTRMITSMAVLFDRPIFEHDEGNTHLEVVGEVQLACRGIQSVLEGDTNLVLPERAKGTRKTFMKNLEWFGAKYLDESPSNDQWLGGISFDGGVFASLAANILGAQAFNAEGLERWLLRYKAALHPSLLVEDNTKDGALFAM